MAEKKKKPFQKKLISVQEMIKVEKEKLSDEEFFTSPQYHKYMSNKVKKTLAASQIPDVTYKIFYRPEDETTAFTDNKRIVVNAANSLVTGSRAEKHGYVCGMTFHELGHILFTNFTANRMFRSNLESGKFYPAEPKVKKDKLPVLQEMLDFLSEEGNGKMLTSVTHELINILEDGRIENLLFCYCAEQRTFYDGLMALRDHVMEDADDIDTLLKKVEAGKMKEFEFLAQILIHYVRFGEIKGYSRKEHGTIPLVVSFDRMRAYADVCLDSMGQTEFYRNFNLMVLEMWPEIKAYIDQMKKEQKQQSGSGSSGSGSASGASGSSGSGSSAKEIAEAVSKAIEKSLGGSQGTTQKASEAASGTGTDNQKIKNIIAKATAKANASEKKEKSGGQPAASSSEKGGSGDALAPDDGESEEKDFSGEEGKAPAYMKTDGIWFEKGGKRHYIDHFIEESNTKVDVSKITNQIASERADEALEKQMQKDLEEFNADIDYGKMHEGMSSCIIRHEATDDLVKQYNACAGPIKDIAKKMAKKSDFYSEDESPVLVKNKYCGTKFNAASIARADFKNFSKKYDLEQAPQLAVAVLIDESGSMGGTRSHAAKTMAIMVYEYCRLMDIPVSIYGHSTGYSATGHVKLYAYADFERVDDKDRYRLMNISARQSNRDGYALRFMKEKLEAQEADKKLLMIVSDGSPADTGYYGTAADADLQDVVKQCQKAGIGFMAAAIGSDKEQIKAIYGERHFLDITDLTVLPRTMVTLIKRLLK